MTSARLADQRVLVLHNRYRVTGGEERAIELLVAALRSAGVEQRLLERDSGELGRLRAATALLAGGTAPDEVGAAARELGATVVHAHNIQPLLGPRALEAAAEAGARVVLQLHNFRLFCAIGVAFRDGEPCFRCRRGLTLPGLALNCRGSLPEAAAYAVALNRQLPAVLAAVDRFAAPSRYAAGQLVRLGVPADRIDPLPHYLPATAVAPRSQADRGEFALAAGRLADEKGFDVAIEAAALAGVPLKIAGDGPRAAALRRQADEVGRGRIELLGPLSPGDLDDLRARAAVALVPSRSDETFGFAALEAMAAGLPVLASRSGALPEIVGDDRCFPRGDAPALATALEALWRDPARRRTEGDALLARARERFGEQRFLTNLAGVYSRAAA